MILATDADFDISKFKVKEGWLYMVKDHTYPDFVKIGRTTNLRGRLNSYNSDRPIKNAYVVAVSRKFDYIVGAEDLALDLVKQLDIEPAKGTFEWFPEEETHMLLDVLNFVELEYDFIRKHLFLKTDIHPTPLSHLMWKKIR